MVYATIMERGMCGEEVMSKRIPLAIDAFL
jgi:hypothetical protein